MRTFWPRNRHAILEQGRLVTQALRLWIPRQVAIALVAATTMTLVIGFATVLIPNPVFARDIAPVWWNYPVWLLTGALSGMLVATYFGGSKTPEPADESSVQQLGRPGKLGVAGGFLAWFAVGCPVCNKLALLALGYSGAITWFAPIQPVLAVGALVLTGVALFARLRGQVACPVRERPMEAAR